MLSSGTSRSLRIAVDRMLPGERDSVCRAAGFGLGDGLLPLACYGSGSEVRCYVVGPAFFLRVVLCNRLQGREAESSGSTETSAVSNLLSFSTHRGFSVLFPRL